MEINRIYLGDSFELDKEIPDKSVDMILEDMPYGTTACKWDQRIDLEKYWESRKRIIKENGAIVLTTNQPFTSILINSNIKEFKYCWYWDRCIKSNFLNAKHQPIRHIETIPVFYKGKPTYNPILKAKRKDQIRWNNIQSKQKQTETLSTVGYLKNRFERREIPLDMDYPTEMLTFSLPSANKGRNHPTEKPIELMEYIIKTYTNEGDLVFDGFSGSGTTAVACLNTRRNFICIEKEQEYFDKSIERLERQRQQFKLAV